METHLQSPLPELEVDEHLPPLGATKRILRRGRDISSRYMTPASPLSAPSSPIHPSLTSSSSISQSFSTLHHSSRNPFHNPKHRRIPSCPSSSIASGFEFEASSLYADENQPIVDPPLPHGVQGKAPTNHRRTPSRIFSEKMVDVPHAEHHLVRLRPERCVGTPRPDYCSQNLSRSANMTATHEVRSKSSKPFMSVPSPEKSLTSVDSRTESCSIRNLGGLCHSPLIRVQGNFSTRQTSDLRSSTPDTELLPTSLTRQALGEELKIRRSLNSALSSCPGNSLNLINTINRQTSVQDWCNFGRNFLPPQPPSGRLGLDMKNGKKGSSRKEDVYALYLLHNQYLHWRFANAKAKIACKARAITAERSLSVVSKNLKEFRNSVVEKRMELEKLRRLEDLSNIFDLEMPYLEEWAIANGEFSSSLSGTIKALQDALIRLPLIGDSRVDIKELKEAFHSLTSMFESLSPSVGRFLPMAGEVEKVITDLASVASKEKSLFEEYRGLLPKVQLLQVNECSLRSMLLQVKRSSII